MIETVNSSIWEDLIHSQRWEELRARLKATHSSDTAEAMGQIHAKEQAVVFRLLSRDHAAQVFSYLPPTGRSSCFVHSPRRGEKRPGWDASR